MSDPNANSRIFRPDVTVAAVVHRDGRFLLVEERVRGQSVINQPAGHLEPHESLVAATIRETLEETAWDIEPTALLGTYQWVADDGTHFLRFAMIAEARRQHPDRALDAGIERTLWLTADEVSAQSQRTRSPLVLACIEDYLAGVRHPLHALRQIQ